MVMTFISIGPFKSNSNYFVAFYFKKSCTAQLNRLGNGNPPNLCMVKCSNIQKTSMDFRIDILEGSFILVAIKISINRENSKD